MRVLLFFCAVALLGESGGGRAWVSSHWNLKFAARVLRENDWPDRILL
jgi:hypothetical protein